MKNQINIAIIPARGGSKRLPGKNMLPLDGKPLIEHTINYAKSNTNILEKIFVSTDDKRIKNFSLKNGVNVIDRPENLSDDYTSTVEVLKHAVENIDINFDNVVLLQVTNPLRPKTLLKTAFKEYHDGRHDSLMTVTRNSQKFGKINDGVFEPFNYEFGQRSQDLEPLYFENGLLYISKRTLILKGQILGDSMLPYIVNHPYADIDIDEEKDMLLADYIIKNKSDYDN